MDDHDWLDQRLAATTYIPDDGFTARVVENLPVRPSRALVLRGRILALTAFLAVCLALVQVIPLFHTFQHATARLPAPGTLAVEMLTLSREPLVQVGVGAAAMLIAFGLLPLLRRWA